MTTRDLNVARKNLTSSLGENTKLYFEKMKLWFQMKTTKEEFDSEVRSIMTVKQIHLHNEFLLCLFNKVRGLAATTPIKTSKLNNIHPYVEKDKGTKDKGKSLKRKYQSDNSKFEPADVYVEVLSQTSSPVGDEPIGANRSSAQELLLPDRTFVLARLMLAAWENNMDGAEENTAHFIVVASQIFLKNLITAIITRRKSFAVHEKSFIYRIGEPVPSSWKRNTLCPTYAILDSYSTDNILSNSHITSHKNTAEDLEQSKAFSMACSTQTLPPPLPQIGISDLLQTMKVHKNLIDNHTVYATNMERLFTYPTHYTWEDLESKKLLQTS